MKGNKKIRKIMTFVLVFTLLCGMIPVNSVVASAATCRSPHGECGLKI